MNGKKIFYFIVLIGTFSGIFFYSTRTQNSSGQTVVYSRNSLSPSPPALISATTPPKKYLWGAYVGDNLDDASKFETLVGASMNMQSIFVGWGPDETFPLSYGPSVRDENKTLVLFWEPTNISLDSISSGTWDGYIKNFARDVKTYGGPVILVPFHEMNDDEISWSGAYGNNTPQKVITAWQHIHNFFLDDRNVKFAWDVNSNSVPDTAANAIQKYYPGDEYVDYVTVDGFNFGTPWVSFDEIFRDALNTLEQYHKPIYILSMASAAGPKKADWITNAFLELQQYPDVVGWVWFNVNKEADWRVNSDPSSLQAFINVVK